MKRKRKISAFLALFALIGGVFSLSSCNKGAGDSGGNKVNPSATAYKYGVEIVWQDPQSVVEHFSSRGFDPDDLLNLNVSLNAWDFPAGIECLGYYSEDGKMLFDKNGKISNAAAAKVLIEENKAAGATTLLRLRMQWKPLTASVTLYTGGGAARWGDDPQESIEQTFSYFDFIENPESCLPRLWKEGAHFFGWEIFGMYSDSTILLWKNDHYESLYQDVYGEEHLTKVLTDLMNALCEPNPPGIVARYRDSETTMMDVYAFSGEDEAYRYFQIQKGTNILTDNTDFANYRPKSTPTKEHSFFAWSKSKTTYIPFDGAVSGDMEIYWREVGEKKCTFNYMTGDAPMEIAVYDNDLTDLSEGWTFPAPDGYTFAGWYKARDYAGEPISVKEIPSYDEIEYGKTYYAKWEKQA